MKKLILILAILALLAVADARIPKIGDHVKIVVPSGPSSVAYGGNITDISNGFICMNCSELINVNGSFPPDSENICIGIGQIRELLWY
jgi:hypothetical protein